MTSFLATILSLLGCSPSKPTTSKLAPITNDAEHNQRFQEGSALIKPYMRLHGVQGKIPDSNKARAEVERGISCLDAVIVYNPTNWAAWWTTGKGYQALDAAEKACDAFERAYQIQKGNPDVAREYMFECLEVGRTAEAISAAEHAVSLSPKDSGLHANLALAYTLAGRIPEAQTAISKSLEIDPADQISLTLRRIVQEIADGRRQQPRNIRELEGRK